MGCAPNASRSPGFLLVGFSRARVSPSLFFLVFLAVYLTIILGAMTLVLLTLGFQAPLRYVLPTRGLSVT